MFFIASPKKLTMQWVLVYYEASIYSDLLCHCRVCHKSKMRIDVSYNNTLDG
jgi:hypothetical protein